MPFIGILGCRGDKFLVDSSVHNDDSDVLRSFDGISYWCIIFCAIALTHVVKNPSRRDCR